MHRFNLKRARKRVCVRACACVRARAWVRAVRCVCERAWVVRACVRGRVRARECVCTIKPSRCLTVGLFLAARGETGFDRGDRGDLRAGLCVCARAAHHVCFGASSCVRARMHVSVCACT